MRRDNGQLWELSGQGEQRCFAAKQEIMNYSGQRPK